MHRKTQAGFQSRGRLLPAGSKPHGSAQRRQEARGPAPAVWAERLPKLGAACQRDIASSSYNSHFQEEIG